MDYDIIVIGSGLGGLTLGSRLATFGYKVGVFEKHFIPGGYATNFKRKGYNFDVSLHGIGGLDKEGVLRSILKACDVIDKITPLKNEEAYYVNVNGENIEIPNDKDKYLNLLIDRFPKEEKGLKNLFKAIDSFEIGFKKFIIEKDSNIFNKLNKHVALFINWAGKSTYSVVEKYIKDEELIKIFTTLWMYYGLAPKELSALYFFIPWISYHKYGKYYIKGGAQSLSNAFVDVIKSRGGEIHLKSEVSKILYEEGRVLGIELKNGQVFKGKRIVSNINPISTYKMLPKGALKEKEVEKIFQDKIGCTLTQLYLGLDCNPSKLNIPKDEVFILGEGSHEKNYEISLKSDYKKASFLLTNYNGMDPSLNEEDKGVLTVTYLDNYDNWSDDKKVYKEEKERATEEILNRVETYYPGIKNHVIIKELGTPKTMERYTGNPKGAVYGYAQTVQQAGRYRLPNKSSIENLSFVGAWVSPGGGYEGTISGGITEAERILKLDK